MATVNIGEINTVEYGGTDLGLWELSDPETAVKAASALYGSSAATAAAWCALSARCDGRQADYRFWLSVFVRLREG